ncbi:MAG TPA: ATP-binding protein [Longimicrobiaceae bacterium]|nr:ATP-binding protein [Longimicrobiaceae bacterium]
MRLRADQKLFLSYLAITAAVVGALTFGVGSTLRSHLMEMVAADMRREVVLARAMVAQNAGLPPDSLADWLGNLSGRRVTIIDRTGRVLGDSRVDGADLRALENHAHRPEVAAALAGRIGQDVRRSHSLGSEQMYVAAPGPHGEAIRVAVTLDEMHAAVRRVQNGIFGVGLVALVLTGLLSFGFSIAVTRPLRQLAGVARAMAAGDLDRRSPLHDHDELGELADALDTLAAELQRRLGQLEGERADVQALIDAMSEGVIAVGRDGRVRRANPAARRIFSIAGNPRGIDPETVTRQPAFRELLGHAMEGRAGAPTEMADADRQLLATAQPLPGGGAVMVFLDVSELRRLEGVRRDFVANASHELKTPLTVIRGYSETLLDDSLPPDLRRQFAGTVKDNADRLQRIVDDLLDLSRLESGGWRVHPEILSVPEVAAEAWAPFAADAARKDARFAIEGAPEAEYVSADPSALRQVLSNLFSNSLRYLPPGGTIRVRAVPAQGPGAFPANGAGPSVANGGNGSAGKAASTVALPTPAKRLGDAGRTGDAAGSDDAGRLGETARSADAARPADAGFSGDAGRNGIAEDAERSVASGDAEQSWVAIEVSDTGSGIPAAHLPRIFERFYRADTARSRAEGGTGLGLSIVRHLIERHGGTVEATSEVGHGTTIRFTLPVPEEVPEDAETA